MRPAQFFETAQDLLLARKREADRRSCISRAYYGVYLMFSDEILNTIPRTLLQTASLCRGKDHIAHERLPMVLRSSNDAKLQEFGDKLEHLRVARVSADYRLKYIVTQENAANVFESASELADELHQFGLPKVAKIIHADLAGTFGKT